VLSISVLGPVEVRRDDELVSIPAGKTSELLVRLALEAGTAVRADRIVEDLWAEDAVRTRRNTLQSKVAMLRRALGDPSVVVSSDGGYALAVDPADVDALAVVRDTAVASRLLEDGDHRAARGSRKPASSCSRRRCQRASKVTTSAMPSVSSSSQSRRTRIRRACGRS
jgi:DNA-binding SARP family transcriptional activator